MAAASGWLVNPIHFSENLGSGFGPERGGALKRRGVFVGFDSLVRHGERRSQGLRWVARGYGRTSGMVVAASPPTDDAVVITEPLTKEDLVGYLASGCKPKEMWRYASWNRCLRTLCNFDLLMILLLLVETRLLLEHFCVSLRCYICLICPKSCHSKYKGHHVFCGLVFPPKWLPFIVSTSDDTF